MISIGCSAGTGVGASVGPLVVREVWSDPAARYTLHAIDANRFAMTQIVSSPVRGEAQFTVLAGDKVNGWSGERSEVIVGGGSSQFKVNASDGVDFYRVTVRLASDWITPDISGTRWGIFFQLHGPDAYNAPPSIALAAEDGFNLHLLGGDVLTEPGASYPFSDPSLNLGSDVTFIMKVRWSTSADGYVVVYRSGTQWTEVLNLQNVATLQYSGTPPGGEHYWKAGLYRSDSDHTNVLTLGPIVRAKSFEAAASF